MPACPAGPRDPWGILKKIKKFPADVGLQGIFLYIIEHNISLFCCKLFAGRAGSHICDIFLFYLISAFGI